MFNCLIENRKTLIDVYEYIKYHIYFPILPDSPVIDLKNKKMLSNFIFELKKI